MRFLVDAQLPRTLCRILERQGHDALHTLELPDGNCTGDAEVIRVAERESRVVLTKDTDFYHSHLLYGVPSKLVFLRTGNIGVRDLCDLISRNLSLLEQSLQNSTLVELDRQNVRVIR